jgi:prolyl 4-hydroxylase
MEPVKIDIQHDGISGKIYAEKVSGNIYRCLESCVFFDFITYGCEIEVGEIDGKLKFLWLYKESPYETKWFCCTREFMESPNLETVKETVIREDGYWQIDMGGLMSISLPGTKSIVWDRIQPLFQIMTLKKVSENIYVIDDFFDEVTCDEFIRKSEALGYEASTVITEKGQQRLESVRNNYRVMYVDTDLADELWRKAKAFVPAKIGNSIASGLNELFRFYRYEPGQLFKKHIDESFIRSETEASYFTFMIYLNDGYKGGETIFDEIVVTGKKGMALLFLHSLPHEGATVTEGVKYVLRTDIMYKLTGE